MSEKINNKNLHLKTRHVSAFNNNNTSSKAQSYQHPTRPTKNSDINQKEKTNNASESSFLAMLLEEFSPQQNQFSQQKNNKKDEKGNKNDKEKESSSVNLSSIDNIENNSDSDLPTPQDISTQGSNSSSQKSLFQLIDINQDGEKVYEFTLESVALGSVPTIVTTSPGQLKLELMVAEQKNIDILNSSARAIELGLSKELGVKVSLQYKINKSIVS